MTNTHITIGGHKITTNKVGQVHYINTYSSTALSNNPDSPGRAGIWWYILNGICYVLIDNIRSNATGSQVITNSLPPPKLNRVLGVCFENRADVYSDYDTKSMFRFNVRTINVNLMASLTYPVADDWVES